MTLAGSQDPVLAARQARAAALEVRSLDDRGRVYRVTGGRSPHQVIADAQGLVCDCHDFKYNRLETCKHVEAVLLYQQQPQVPPADPIAPRAAADGARGSLPSRPVWRDLLAAARAARAVLRCADPYGLGARSLAIAARAFAFEVLHAANPRSPEALRLQQLALTILATHAAKGSPLADRRIVCAIWREFDLLHEPPPVPRPPSIGHSTRRDRLPVEAARTIPIERVCARLGLELHRKGRTLVARCPFHDDEHPSLTVNVERGLWYCFPCATGGDAIALLARMRRVDFAAAVEEVAAC
jgi:hypothetical protein